MFIFQPGKVLLPIHWHTREPGIPLKFTISRKKMAVPKVMRCNHFTTAANDYFFNSLLEAFCWYRPHAKKKKQSPGKRKAKKQSPPE
jgi:hypothetical protein